MNDKIHCKWGIKKSGECKKKPGPKKKSHIAKISIKKSRKRRTTYSKEKNNSVDIIGPFDKIPFNLSDIATNCNNKKWRKRKTLIGYGKSGSVYIACKGKDDCDYILKEQQLNQDFYMEVAAISEFQEHPGIPIIYAAWKCKGKGYLIIEKLFKCSDNITKEDKKFKFKFINNLLRYMKNTHWYHIDVHPGNVMCRHTDNINYKYVLIDFGWSWKFTPDFVILQNHPLNKWRPDIIFNERVVKRIQKYNLQRFFGYNKTGIKKSIKKYKKLVIKP